MTEVQTLHLLLIAAMATAPVLTGGFLLPPSRLYWLSHGTALVLTTAGLLFDVPQLTFAWFLFCVAWAGRFGVSALGNLTLARITQGVPFAFSVVAATWLISGANGLGLLGYGKTFSFYASLHSHVLGWVVVGATAVLATSGDRLRPVYVAAVSLALLSFFLVAFGINGVPIIKVVGVVGITLTIAAALLCFVIDSRASTLSFGFALSSLVCFGYTIALAWQHELGSVPSVALLGVRPMVSVHGLINGLVLAPCLLLALHFYPARSR